MAISNAMDVMSPQQRRRQQLAQQLMQGGRAKSVHAMPLFRGSGGRDSSTLPAASQPQLTVPYMQDPGVTGGLGVVNPAGPGYNTSPGPGIEAPIRPPGYDIGPPPSGSPPPGAFTPPGAPQAPIRPPGYDIGPPPSGEPPTGSVSPGTPGAGTYADGSPAPQPIMDPNQVLATYGNVGGVRRLVGSGAPKMLPQLMGMIQQPGMGGYY